MVTRGVRWSRRLLRPTARPAAGLAMAGLVATVLWGGSAPAAAAPLHATIGSVSISPQNPRFDRPVTVTVAWCVPNGSKSGDVFDLVVPPQLTPLTSGFGLHDSAGDLVASATVANNVVSVKTTQFVASHSNVCSEMRFPAAIVLDQVRVNVANKIVFRVGNASFPATMKPIEQAGAKPDQAIMYGAWAQPADQGRTNPTGALLWYLESPRAPAGGFHSVTFVDLPTPGQTPDCAAMRVEVGTLDRFNHFIYGGRYTGTVHAACSTERAEVVIDSLDAGVVARAVVPTSPDTQKDSYDHRGTVSVDGGPAVPVKAPPVQRYTAEGTASGRVLAPAVTSFKPGTSAKHGLGGTGVGLLIGGAALALIVIGAAVLVPRRRRRQDPTPEPAEADDTA